MFAQLNNPARLFSDPTDAAADNSRQRPRRSTLIITAIVIIVITR
jgi:hypothetical protein